MSIENYSLETEKVDPEEPMVLATPVSTVPTSATVRVVAPATLVEGATFEAVVDGISFLVAAPEGGVEKGEAFQVPYPRIRQRKNVQGPRWRYDLFACPCSCMCFVAFLCPLLLHSQVMERMNFNIGGCRRRVDYRSTATGFPICPTLVATYYGLYFLMFVFGALQYDEAYFIFYFLFYAWAVFCITAMVNARMSFRQTYNLPSTCCGENCCDDCCITYWCGPCSAIQMANHSADPNVHSYALFSKTGLRDNSQGGPEYARANTEIV